MLTMLTESFAKSRLARTLLPANLAVRILLASLALAALPACGTLYVAQAARGEMQVLRERRPIKNVLADARTSPTLRERLTAVEQARNFASAELGLPDNRSYRSYADLKRPFVVWNVVAAPEFSIAPMHWCFPIAGCVAYRGYFSEHNAEAFGARLAEKNFDVVVEGVAAYSTLGRFADPVLNTMLIYGDDELAAIVFHELAHQLIYVPDDSEFNEAFAVTVEETGLARWLESLGHADELEHFRQERSREMQFNTLFADRRRQLAGLYASKLPVAIMRERKRLQFEELANDMRDLERRQRVRSGYEEWISSGLNNARLASVATYFECVPGFERLLAREGGDLPRFYAAVRALAHAPQHERHRQLCAPSAQRDQ